VKPFPERVLRSVLFLAVSLLPATAVLAQELPPTDSATSAVVPDAVGQQAPPSEAVAPLQVAPVVLKIPALGVDASVFPTGLEEDGAMGVPADPDTVVWWSLGSGTGVPGNVVLAAHVDWGGRLRVFGLLHTLATGDQVVVVDEQLREFTYEIVWSRWYEADETDLEPVFGNNGQPELTLITCGGQFDPATRQYLSRLVVRAVQV
jgi:LPXTG-site transpeptidase (sortase) family protein